MTTTFYLFNPLYIHEIEEKTSLKIKKKYLSPIDHLGKGDYFASIYDLNDNYLFDVSSLFGSFNEKDDIWANSNEVVEINIDKDINNIPIETRIGLQNLIENLNIIFIDYYEYDKLYYQKKSDVEIDTDINYDEYDD